MFNGGRARSARPPLNISGGFQFSGLSTFRFNFFGLVFSVWIAILLIPTLPQPLLAQPVSLPISSFVDLMPASLANEIGRLGGRKVSPKTQSEKSESLQLPNAAVHPLPPSLVEWNDPNQSGDYFDHISAAGFGYLVWPYFPIQVVLEIDSTDDHQVSHNRGDDSTNDIHLDAQQQAWKDAIVAAVQEWNQFLPIEVSDRPETRTVRTADIVISPQTPPLRWPDVDSDVSSSRPLPRARTAETTYKIYLRQTDDQMVMLPQYSIMISPNQSFDYLKATARHEVGHALGLWGHSPMPDDALYFSQVYTPPSISARDINTLKKIYQQPTQLGWPLISE